MSHNILEACEKELRNFEAWRVVSIVRETNQVADVIAKLAKNVPAGLHVLAEPPVEVEGLIENDLVGVPLWRYTTMHTHTL